jgi:hypothetical protein
MCGWIAEAVQNDRQRSDRQRLHRQNPPNWKVGGINTASMPCRVLTALTDLRWAGSAGLRLQRRRLQGQRRSWRACRRRRGSTR